MEGGTHKKRIHEAKKPPGEPGGFFGFSGDDAVRQEQLHDFIMHKSDDGSTAA
jgi:hypothetical protein